MKRYDYLCESVAVVTTITQTQQVFQIVSLILTCLATLFSMCFTIYTWYKKAKQDDKIDDKEINEAIKIVKDHIEVINNNVDNFVENSKKDGDANG